MQALTTLPTDVRTQLVWLRSLFIEILIVALALLGASLNAAPFRVKQTLRRPADLAVLFTQLIMIVAGIAGALGRAFVVDPRPDKVFIPALDATTVLWLALIPLGLLLPRLQKFEFGGASFSVTTDTAPAAITDVASLLENWTGALNLLTEWLPTDKNPAETIRAFLRDRGDEALREMSPPGEYLRLSYWLWVDEAGGLTFLFSNQINDDATKSAVFRAGEGCMGMAYREQRAWNEPRPHELACWKKIPGETTDFFGLLLIPITWGKTKIGMIAIDREAAEKFNEVSVQIASALAYLAASALGSPVSTESIKRASSTTSPSTQPPPGTQPSPAT